MLMAAFTDIDAPDYRSFRYSAPGGVSKLVFFRQNGESVMQVVTLTLSGDFATLYPPLRPRIESMLAHSVVRLD
jgi:hypothetical protein